MAMKSILYKSRIANPAYTKFKKIWQKVRDSILGEEQIKIRSLEQNTKYLKEVNIAKLAPITTFDQYIRPTDSMRRLGEIGYQRFCDYVYRAKFYPFPAEIQSQSLGLIETEPPVIELPTELESMRSSATIKNESLKKVLSIVNTQQIQVSRIGLLLNPSASDDKPFNIAFYLAETILDWNYTIFNDSEIVYDWFKLLTDEVDEDDKPIFLILLLVDGIYTQYKTTNEKVQYDTPINEDDGFITGSLIQPKVAEAPISEIPFIVINTRRLGTDIERPFIESIVDAALSLYRASAHHEDALYWGGESTMFTKGYGLGEDENIYVGNGATNKTNAEYADAKYVTLGTDGIAPREQNKDKLFEYCVNLGVDLLNKGVESGVALKIRSNVKTASLKNLSLTGGLGLQMLLRLAARWIGADESEVIVTPNTTFADIRYSADDFVKFATMLDIGAMRPRDMYSLQLKNNITTAEIFEDWESELVKPVEPTNNISTQMDENA